MSYYIKIGRDDKKNFTLLATIAEVVVAVFGFLLEPSLETSHLFLLSLVVCYSNVPK